MNNNITDLAKIAQEYRELNPSSILVLDRPPSALEFLRLIHIARPVLIKNSKHIDYQQWTPDFLTEALADSLISVAITPQGQGADALAMGKLSLLSLGYLHFLITFLRSSLMPRPGRKDLFRRAMCGEDDNGLLFAPHSGRIHTINARTNPTHSETIEEVLYLQSQNGNLYPGSPSEFDPLLRHVPPEISWASEALGDGINNPFLSSPELNLSPGRSPDAVNLWIGDNRSITSIHAGEDTLPTNSTILSPFQTDPYENIYTVVRGVKYFTLVPPTEVYSLHGKQPHIQNIYNLYPHAQYTRSSSGSLALTPTSKVVRWSSIKDPSIPGVLSTGSPYRIVVQAGDTLYLPPGWWHYVKQTVDETGICVALNWWYDMEMQGMNWIWLQYMRGTLGDGNDESDEGEGQ